MLINWLCGTIQDHLNDSLCKQDLKLIIAQICTNLLAAGVLRQCEQTKNEHIFKVLLIRYLIKSILHDIGFYYCRLILCMNGLRIRA